jgi:hypothetical protein
MQFAIKTLGSDIQHSSGFFKQIDWGRGLPGPVPVSARAKQTANSRDI